MSTSSPEGKIAQLSIALRFESISGRLFFSNSIDSEQLLLCLAKMLINFSQFFGCGLHQGSTWRHRCMCMPEKVVKVEMKENKNKQKMKKVNQ